VKTKKIDEPDSAVVESLHDTFSKMFTKENLEIDPYLRPHLSQSMSLPLEVVVKVCDYYLTVSIL
jgi:hypothetical protein